MATVIRTATQLQNMSADLTADYELGSDIDALITAGWNGGLGFDPIGTYTIGVPANAFSGSFDGKGYKIRDLTINRPLEDYVGLFGYTIGAGEEIKNVGLEDCDITGGQYAIAGLVGFNDDDRAIINCWITGAIVIADTDGNKTLCGGLSGYTEGTVTGCYFSGTIDHSDSFDRRIRQSGGLIGLIGGGTVTECYSAGTFTLDGVAGSFTWEIGGFAGMNSGADVSRCFSTMAIVIDTSDDIYGIAGFIADNSGDIANCYARGAVTANGTAADVTHIAGFVAYHHGTGTIDNCYSTGLITTNGLGDVGGFLPFPDGIYDTATVTDSFWDTQTSGEANSDGGTGKTTAQMKSIRTIQAAGWAISTIWSITGDCNGDYPCLLGVNTCCSVSSGSVDQTIIGNKVSLEAIRNLEIVYGGRDYVSKSGIWVHESRYHRNV